MTLVIPAIDLRDGQCVRLYQGSYERETVYFDDPVKIDAGFKVSVEEDATPSLADDGTVIDQTPNGGNSVAKGSTVTITVATT